MPFHSQENTCFNCFCKLSLWLIKLQVMGVQKQTKRTMMHKNVAVTEDVRSERSLTTCHKKYEEDKLRIINFSYQLQGISASHSLWLFFFCWREDLLTILKYEVWKYTIGKLHSIWGQLPSKYLFPVQHAPPIWNMPQHMGWMFFRNSWFVMPLIWQKCNKHPPVLAQATIKSPAKN